jgi:hypothetical protein
MESSSVTEAPSVLVPNHPVRLDGVTKSAAIIVVGGGGEEGIANRGDDEGVTVGVSIGGV